MATTTIETELQETAPRLNTTGNGRARVVQQPVPESRDVRGVHWELIWARALYWIWSIVMKLIVTIVYLGVGTTGAKRVFPDLGLKLYKLPGLAFMEDFTLTYRLDLSHLFVAIPIVAAWVFWQWMLEIHLCPDVFEHKFRRFHLENTKRIVTTLGVVIITADALLFGAAFAMARWGSARFSFTTVVAIVAYVCIVGVVSFVSMWLGQNVQALKTSGAKK